MYMLKCSRRILRIDIRGRIFRRRRSGQDSVTACYLPPLHIYMVCVSTNPSKWGMIPTYVVVLIGNDWSVDEDLKAQHTSNLSPGTLVCAGMRGRDRRQSEPVTMSWTGEPATARSWHAHCLAKTA